MTASYEVRAVAEAEGEKWDRMAGEASGGCIYLTSAWAGLVNAHYGSGEFIRVGVFEGEVLVGGVAGLMRQLLKQETLVMPLMTQYGGPVVAAGRSDAREIVNAIISRLEEFGLIHLIGFPGFKECNPFAEQGYSVGLRQTYYLDVSGELEAVWKGFGSNVQRNIRKAERAGFRVERALEDVEAALRLFEAPFLRRGGKSGVPETFLRAVLEGGEVSGQRRLIAAYEGDRLVSYICWLIEGDRAYYAVATTDPEELASGVSSFLIWRSLEMLTREGVRVVDFLGANIPSIAAFKARFGCELVSYPVFRKVKSKRIAAALSVQSMLAKGFSWRRRG